MIMYKIKDFFEKKLKYNDSHANIIRIRLKKEVKTFYDRTEDFHLKYTWKFWGLHRIYDKIEDYLENNSDIMIGIQIELSHNWKGSGDIFLIKLKISYSIFLIE